jgi:hypothetical protein
MLDVSLAFGAIFAIAAAAVHVPVFTLLSAVAQVVRNAQNLRIRYKTGTLTRVRQFYPRGAP